MTIADIIRNGKGKAGHHGAWEVTQNDYDDYVLTHYGHKMLIWTRWGNRVVVLYVDTGHGSVSDQHGMNTAFRVLGAPSWYFSRKGGAKIVDVETREEVTLLTLLDQIDETRKAYGNDRVSA